MLEDPPFDLLCPGRRPTGLAPVLLPFLPSGEPDWDGFAHLLGRTVDAGLTPLLSGGPGSGDLLDASTRAEVVATDGRLDVVRVGGPYDLFGPAGPDRPFLADRSSFPRSLLEMNPTRFPQNWGATADLPTVARLAAELYPQSRGGAPLDGVAGVSYKFAAPVNDLGTLTADGPYGVAGKVGAAPGLIPVTVVAHDADRGTHSTLRTNVADERALGYPGGYAALSLVAPAAAAQASYTALDGNPSAQTGSMCLTVTLEGRTKPIRFCNRYVGAFGGASGIGMSPLVADVAQATGDIGTYQFGLPAITKVRITMTLRRGTHQAYLTGVRAPAVVHRGHMAKLRITTRSILDGKVSTQTVRVRIPRSASRGVRVLSLQGTAADATFGGGGGDSFSLADLFGTDTGSTTGPHTVDGLAKQVDEIHRVEGVELRLQPRKLADSLKGVTDPEELQALLAAQKSQTTVFPAHILRSRTLRTSGTASTTVVVR